MDDTLIRPARPPRTSRRGAVAAGCAAVLFLALVAIASPALRSPARVSEVTLENSGTWVVRVEVRVDGGWSTIGTVPPGSRSTVADVLDAGGTWQLRFRVGEAMVTERVERSRLAAASWRISVPESMAAATADEGIGPTPPGS